MKGQQANESGQLPLPSAGDPKVRMKRPWLLAVKPTIREGVHIRCIDRCEGSPMILYYRERNGDFLAIDTSTNRYYRTTLGKDHHEGRATAIASLVSSVCATSISREFLRTNCKRVPKARVPERWLRAIGFRTENTINSVKGHPICK
jgi:hypothetical protein